MCSLQYVRSFAVAFAWAAVLLGFPAAAAPAPVLPAGYTLVQAAGQFDFPTNLAWLPDGAMLVTEKAGVVKVIRNGTVQVLADLRATTNDYWDHGMLGIAVDPDYAANHYLYLMRTYENNVNDYIGTKVGQLVRITVNAAGTALVPGSLTVLLGKLTPPSCATLPSSADCISADGPSHSVGELVFGTDGTLYASNGDAAQFTYTEAGQLRAQDLDSLNGKIVHITRNGEGLSSNPFYNGNVNANRSKVFAYGLRNPWRMAFKPGTQTLYLSDVGSDAYEEINVAASGGNYGWPCYEGNTQRDLSPIHDGCAPLYAAVAQGQAAVRAPLVAWLHVDGGGAFVGGTFVTGPSYPTAISGSYLYGDYVHQFIRSLRTNTANQLSAGPNEFITGFLGLVNIKQGPDGLVYIVSIADDSNNPGTGSVQRLVYQATGGGGGTACADGQFKAEYFNGIALAGTAALTRCEAPPLAANWQLGAPVTAVAADNFSARWSGNFTLSAGSYRFDAAGDDGVRVLVDGVLVLNGWKDQQYTAYQKSLDLAAGKHAITVEYYDSGQDAAVSASWTRLGDGGGGAGGTCAAGQVGQFQAQYFNNATLAGAAVLTRCETAPLNHMWVLGSPGTGLGVDNFSARWSGAFDFAGGPVAFDVSADDGVRLLLDGSTVLNGWRDQPTTRYANSVEVEAGRHTVTVEYYEAAEDAAISVGWSGAGTPPPGCANNQFSVDFFNNIALSGTPVRSACEAGPLAHDWGLASPGSNVNADDFSARWSGNFDFSAGQYQFIVSADDGVRLSVDGVSLIDGWADQQETTYQASATLTAGSHRVTVEYYDSGEEAVLRARWQASATANRPPMVTIAAPANGATVAIGSSVAFSGSAIDPEDGPLAPAGLLWNVVIQHCTDGLCHSHFLQRFSGAGGSFTYPDHGADDYYVELSLTATDAAGLQTMKKVRLNPRR